MSIKVALEHRTSYEFDRSIGIGPHLIRLRPAPHCRTPIESYSLDISPSEHYLNWQQDPFGNHVARAVFPAKAERLDITVGLVADLSVINPFDFFVEDYAASYPFSYPDDLARDLEPYLKPSSDAGGPLFADWATAESGLAEPQPVVGFLGQLNSAVFTDVAYSVRMEVGFQSPDETLRRRVGSCRDSAWLLVAALRHHGLAARFVSGYLVQLAEDGAPAGPDGGPAQDITDLHAWAEVFIPGAGWIGLDPTSSLFAGEGHIPLSATPHPSSAAPITGATEPTVSTFSFSNTVRRVHEDARVSRPYTPGQREQLDALGRHVDRRLQAAGLELTMGGEPTFVSMDDMTSPQWTVAADGEDKRERAGALAASLAGHFGPGGLVQRSQGKWYPGEPLPRWQIALIWRRDSEPLWHDPTLLADPYGSPTSPDPAAAAESLARAVTTELGLPGGQCLPCVEDPLAALTAELQRPDDEPDQPDQPDQSAEPDREAVAALDGQQRPVAWALPLVPDWWGEGWASPTWTFRRGRLVLVPGELPAGARLPLASVSWLPPDYQGEALPARAADPLDGSATPPQARVADPDGPPARTALVFEARAGHVHVYLPPLEKLERFVQLVRLLERVAAAAGTPVVLEGYGPPPDPRVNVLMVTPDPGVIEVNLQPTASWDELRDLTRDLYELARQHRLGAETFAPDGRHSGTGGGNHITLGAAEPSRSPLLRRPDLLVSMITFWQHHPAISYLFAGRFVGSTSQAPRVDEGRPETLYELEIAFAEIERLAEGDARPWAVDRALRNLLSDITGNTHRSEFCIDKLYSPESARGRLGLLELRGFEMPPHPDMALVQALLVRALVARFAEQPYAAPLIRWGATLHERFLLPHYVAADIAVVVADLRAHGFDFDLAWLAPYLEFRFPRIGITKIGDIELELRQAIEPWNVLAEDASSGATSRYVDSSTERIQVLVNGFVPERHVLTCNRVPVPLTATGTLGQYVAGIRYRAWRPWSSLHPSLEIDAPLRVDLVDRANRVSLGGATYHVVDPSGRVYDRPPVNALEAEARRAGRFVVGGQATGEVDVDALTRGQTWRTAGETDHPVNLDLRRRVPRSWGRS